MNTEVMKNAVEKIESILSVLAQKIGVGVDHFYPIFVSQQKVEALTAFVIMGFVVFVNLCFWIGSYIYIRNNKNKDTEGLLVAGIIFSIITFIVAIIISALCLPKNLNPEYYALQDIIRMFR